MRFPDEVPVLTSGDVTLRAHRPDDIDAIVEQCVDPVSVRWTTVPLDYSHTMGEEWVTKTIPEAWESDSEYLFAIEASHSDGRRRFCGSVSLRARGSRRAEVAFGAHPGVRGKGVMSTAVGLILDWGFDDLGLETVLWLANVGNVGSRRVAWHTGFTFGGTMRRWLEHRGEYLDAWVATVHRDDPRTPATRWIDSPRLQGREVVLRPLDEGDLDSVVEGCSDTRTQHWLGFLPRPYGRSEAEAWLVRVVERASQGESVWWAVEDRSTGGFVGAVGLPRMGRGEGEVGYWSNPGARGRGVTTEAVGLLVRHALAAETTGGLGLRRLTLHAAAGNAASRHVALSNGFRQYGVERRAERLGDGTYDDIVLFDLMRPQETA